MESKYPGIELELSCGNCIHYAADEKRKQQGFCRRYPPSMHLIPGPQKAVQMPGVNQTVNITAQSLFPTTHEQNFCGECAVPPPARELDS